MSQAKPGKMMWKRERDGRLALYLCPHGQFWWSHYANTKYKVPNTGWQVSEGYATMQALLKQGWVFIPTPREN